MWAVTLGKAAHRFIEEGTEKELIMTDESKKIYAPGIYHNMPFEEYRQIDAFNNSFLWTLRERSPFHAIYEKDHPSEPTPAFEFGRLQHMAVLEPVRWNEVCKIPDDAPRRPTDRQINAKKPSAESIIAIDWWTDFEAATNGKQIISSDWFDQIEIMCDALRRMQSYHLICSGRSEVVLIWDDDGTGLRMKARLDYVQESFSDTISDVKSTTCAACDSFSRSIYSYGYFQGAAIYCDGWRTLTGNEPTFVWFAMEKDAPYATKAWEADEDVIVAGRNSYKNALKTCKECIARNYWPGYGTEPDVITMTDWALRREGVGPYNLGI